MADLSLFPTPYSGGEENGFGQGFPMDTMMAPSQSAPPIFGGTGFEDEPPLLEELGIDFGHIRTKTLMVLNPFSKNHDDIIGDSDLAGPLVFCLLLGSFLLLAGKIHFGYIYGMGLMGCLMIYFLLNLMSENGIDIYRCASILGYCLLPMVFASGLAIFITINSPLGYILLSISVIWCTYSASTMFVMELGMVGQRVLVGYPIGLLYTSFALLL